MCNELNLFCYLNAYLYTITGERVGLVLSVNCSSSINCKCIITYWVFTINVSPSFLFP